MFRRYQFGDVTWTSFQSVLLCCAVSSQLRNSSVLTHSHSDSSAATSSATGEHGTVPERPSRNEEQNSIYVSKRCAVRLDIYFSTKTWFSCIISIYLMNFWVLSYYVETFGVLIVLISMCRYGNKHFDVLSWGVRLFHFPSNHGKGVTYEGRKGRKSICFPLQFAFFIFIVNMIKVLFPIFTLI